MRKNLLINLLVFLVLIISFNLVTAQPPFQQTEFSLLGIQVEGPVIEFHEQNQPFDFHAHAYNITDGLPLTPAGPQNVTCELDLYDPVNGSHTLVLQMISDSFHGDKEWHLTIAAGNFTRIGQYSVIMECKTNLTAGGNIGGFFEYGFDVTFDGGPCDLDSATKSYGFVLFFFIILFIGFIYLNRTVNFEGWYNSILSRYKEKNYIKVVLSSIFYNTVKNKITMLYFLGFPIMIIITDIIYSSNIDTLTGIMNSIMFVYTWCIVLVAFSLFGQLQEFIVGIIDDMKKINWGFNFGK